MTKREKNIGYFIFQPKSMTMYYSQIFILYHIELIIHFITIYFYITYKINAIKLTLISYYMYFKGYLAHAHSK